ncbi:MAG TPA: hypothetical protein PK109_01560 [Candidatus Paceibacterota bacterium]|nr:hypothetical protein [Candidatus Paceibacterota bacterium]
MVQKTAAAIVLILLLGYGAVKAFPLVRGPHLQIDTPTNYTTSEDGFTTISGVAHNTEALFLNGGPLLIDPEGRFYETLLLPSGGAILTLTANDRFGRTVTERLQIYVP